VKAVILAAGEGKRLGRITSDIPKPMIEVNGKPILEHNLDMCRKAGVKDIYINLHHLPDKISNYFNNGSNYGVNIKYNFEAELLGTAGAILPFKNYLKNDPFFIIYGDNYLFFDLMEIKVFHEEMNADISILFHWRNNVNNSGVAVFDKSDRIKQFIEKPLKRNYSGDWVNAGIYYIEANDIFDLIQPKDDYGFDIFPKMLNMNYSIFGYKTTADLIAIDTPELLAESSKNKK